MTKMTSIKRHPIVFVIVCSVLLGCSHESNQRQIEKYVQKVKSRPKKTIEPLPEFKEFARFEYPTDDKRRNPFARVLVNRVDNTGINQPDQNRRKQPLEAFPLDSLRMVGLLQRDNRLWALITASNGIVYRVTVGNYLGQNEGKISEINQNEIKIIETVQLSGRWEHRPATLVIKD